MSTAALPIYCYQSLTELDAIRLIHLYPARETASQLQCSIEQSTLAQYSQNLVHHYIALSYVWGDPVSTRSIVVEGYSLSITTNLDSSLRHIRDKEHAIRVWADAICINQSDILERNEQVQQMGFDIFCCSAQHHISRRFRFRCFRHFQLYLK
jgi:hypothetical protein